MDSRTDMPLSLRHARARVRWSLLFRGGRGALVALAIKYSPSIKGNVACGCTAY